MAYLMEYWDTLDIGRPELNHSQGFFRRTHSLHEKTSSKREDPSPKNLKTQKSSLASTKNDDFVSATIKKDVPKQNVKDKASNKENVPANKSVQQQPNRAILAVSIVNKKSQNNGNQPTVKSSSNIQKQQKPQQPQRGVVKKSTSVTSSATSVAKGSNEKPKMLTKSVSAHRLTSKTDKLYEQAEIQKKRKEVLAKKIKAEEEKECKFKFHAKPVPKFVKTAPSLQAIIKQQQITKQNSNEEKKKLVKQQSLPTISTITSKKANGGPAVPSCGNPDRIKAIIEHKKQLIEKYKPENIQFRAKPATVLQKTVFQPKHNFKQVDAKPFKLILTQRMMQRSTFDKQLQEALAIKEKQKEILQRQHDLEERKLMRQKTEFKARPNPFGRY